MAQNRKVPGSESAESVAKPAPSTSERKEVSPERANAILMIAGWMAAMRGGSRPIAEIVKIAIDVEAELNRQLGPKPDKKREEVQQDDDPE